MRVLACGGRHYADKAFAFLALDRLHARAPITLLIEGGAMGADRFARQWAQGRGIEVATYLADWDLYGKRAGRVRNAKMLREGHPDVVVAFEGGVGTAHMVSIAREAGTKVWMPRR